MSNKTNQMSLLDAIGLTAPEETNPTEQTAGKKPKKAATKRRKANNIPAETAAIEAAAAEPANVAPGLAGDPAPGEISASTEDFPTLDGAALESVPGGPLPLDRYLCFALYSANHAMHGVYKALLKEVGLTYPQFLAMTVLWEKNNVPVGAITSKLQLDTNTLTPLLKRLEAIGLLTRTRSARDERQVMLKLTRKGKNLQKKTEHFGQCVFSSTKLTLEEVMDLQRKIMVLRDNLRESGLS